MRNHTKKFLSVLLSLAMLFTVAIPAISAAGAKNGTSLALIPYDASKLGVKKLGEVSEAVKEAAKHDPDEIVRVSIVLSGKSTLDAGFATKNVAKNASAVAYRNSLKADNRAYIEGCSKMGEPVTIIDSDYEQAVRPLLNL